MPIHKSNKHIEIVSSTVRGLSSMSKGSRDAIAAALSKHYTDVRVTIINNLAELEALVMRRPDVVFLGMKFMPTDISLGAKDPDKVWIAEYLDSYEIAYTGSGSAAHRLELDKPLAKQCVLDTGSETSPYCVVSCGQIIDTAPFEYPLFVKPTNRGGGLGIDGNSVVHNIEQLHIKTQYIANLGSDSLVEQYLDGREFSVAILQDGHTGEFSLMPIELVAEQDSRGLRILGGAVKSSNTERVLEVTDRAVRDKICDLAQNVFYALGARDYGRIDIRMDKNDKPKFLEANLIPSLISGYGSFPKACILNIDLDYEPMILSIVRLALARADPKADMIVFDGSIGSLNPLIA